MDRLSPRGRDHREGATKRQTTQLAKSLRGRATEAERVLWGQLRAHGLRGFKFKRQQPVGPFIVDFVCFERHLIIELDGGQHVDQQAADEERTRFLEARGFSVLRFWDDSVFNQMEAVLEEILRRLESTG